MTSTWMAFTLQFDNQPTDSFIGSHCSVGTELILWQFRSLTVRYVAFFLGDSHIPIYIIFRLLSSLTTLTHPFTQPSIHWLSSLVTGTHPFIWSSTQYPPWWLLHKNLPGRSLAEFLSNFHMCNHLVVGFDHGLPCRVENMARGTQ